MTEIVLTDEQIRAIAGAGSDVVTLRTPTGELIGYVSRPFTAEEIAQAEADLNADGTHAPLEAVIVAEAKRRLATPGPRYTTAEVLDYLRKLGDA